MPKLGTKRATLAAEEVAFEPRHQVDLSILDGLVGYHLRRAHHVQLQRFAAVFGPFDVRPVQLSLLGVIFSNPGIKQSELGRALDIKRANIVTLLDELEQRSLLTRRRARDDKRSRVIVLTAQGKRFTRRMLDLHERLEQDMTESVGHAERDELLKLLRTYRRLELAPKLDLTAK